MHSSAKCGAKTLPTGATEKLAKVGQIFHVVGNGPWAEVNARNFFSLNFLLFDLLFWANMVKNGVVGPLWPQEVTGSLA